MKAYMTLPNAQTRAPRWQVLLARAFGRRIESIDIDWRTGLRTTVEAFAWRGKHYITSTRSEPMLTPATPAQRSTLRLLLAKAEYDLTAITPLYRRLGVPEAAQGQSLDTWITGLNSLQASDYINKLRKELE